jgi:SAM-dependent methyltransferase
LEASGYHNLTGLDIAPPPTRGAARFVQADLDSAWPCRDDAYELIVAIELIEHVENLGLLLCESRRVLRPGGLMLLTTPNVHSLEARLRWLTLARLKQFDTLGDPTHITPVFLYPFLRLARRHGLEPMQHWGHPQDGSSPTSRPALRRLAAAARAIGLRGEPAGDQLCMVLRKDTALAELTGHEKRIALTAHYAPGRSHESATCSR